jgi:hypothetical protein
MIIACFFGGFFFVGKCPENGFTITFERLDWTLTFRIIPSNTHWILLKGR